MVRKNEVHWLGARHDNGRISAPKMVCPAQNTEAAASYLDLVDGLWS